MVRAFHCGVLVISLGVAAYAGANPLIVSADFPGGSVEVRSIDAAVGRIEIAPAHHEGAGWPCWWYFRVDGAESGQRLALHVGASGVPFREDKKLAANWSLPQRAAISTDDIAWAHTAPGAVTTNGATYEVTAPASRFWLAWGPPFLPRHAEALLASVATELPGSERFELARTREGRPVNGIRVGRRDAPLAIWVQARQHAWETGSSWVGRGFIEWVAGDDPSAIGLREGTEIWFVPIMDVDRVTLGAGGKEAVPRDHNRDWDEAPVYPEVAAAQKRLRALAATGRLRLYIDLHNPGPGDRRPYFYGPLDYEQMPGPQRANYDRFLKCAIERISGPPAIDPKYRFATYVKDEEERRRVSGAWVRQHGGEDVVAVTLEAAWNTPFNTTEGYRQLGRELAKAVERYLGHTVR